MESLVGLKLTIVRNAGGTKVFHFGGPVSDKGCMVGKWALHVQCPWRLERAGRIVTGLADYYAPAEDNKDEFWDPDSAATGHLQDQILGDLLGGFDPNTRSYLNQTDGLRVEHAACDSFGGARIDLAGGYRLVIFPVGTRGEQWRLFEPGSDSPHLVLRDGALMAE
jgi:hypothetical protein